MCPDTQEGAPRIDPGRGATSDNGAEGSSGFSELAAFITERFELFSGSLRRLLSVHKDRAQLAIRRRIQLAILAAAGLFAGSTAIVYGVILVIRGTVLGLTRLFDDRVWLGSLAAGVLVLLAIGAGLFMALRRWDRVQLKKQEAKYAELRRKQDDVVRRPPF
jgi:hypothetical protein